MKEWFIAGNVPSLKNSKIKTSRGIFPSKTVVKYCRNLGVQKYSVSKKEVLGFKTRPNLFLSSLKGFNPTEFPILLGFHFVRGSKHGFDYNNANAIITDLLSSHNLIPDDSADYIIPCVYQRDGKWFSYDKINPGVYLSIFNSIKYK